MLGGLVTFLVAFTCFFGAIRGWSFPPRIKPAFPDIDVEIYGSGSIDTQREGGSGLAVSAHLRSFNARFINTGSEQSARLTVLLYVKLAPASWGRVAEALCPPPHSPPPPPLRLRPLTIPSRP